MCAGSLSSLAVSFFFFFLIYEFSRTNSRKNAPTTVGGEIKWDERKTHRTSSREHDGCSRLIMAMQPPVRCIVGPFQPMGLPAVFRTMVRPNRLIKLNRANESRANPVWGMRACVRACVRLQTSSCTLSSIAHPSEYISGNYRGNTSPRPTSWCCEFNDDPESAAPNNVE